MPFMTTPFRVWNKCSQELERRFATSFRGRFEGNYNPDCFYRGYLAACVVGLLNRGRTVSRPTMMQNGGYGKASLIAYRVVNQQVMARLD